MVSGLSRPVATELSFLLAIPTIAAATDLGANDLALEWTAVGPETAATVHGQGLRLGVWTPNEPGHIAEMIRSGVDWIITDRPDLAPTAESA